MKEIEVIILTGGVMAREINPFGNVKPNDACVYTKNEEVITGKEREYIHAATLESWEKAEAKLRVYDIDSEEEFYKSFSEPKITTSNPETKVELTSAHVLYEPNKKHKAVLLPSGKIKIIPDKDSFHEKFAKKVDGFNVTDTFQFRYTNLGEPNFIKNGSDFADKSHSVSLRDWTPEQLEAMAHFMRNNPLCKLFNDGSGDLN